MTLDRGICVNGGVQCISNNFTRKLMIYDGDSLMRNTTTKTMFPKTLLLLMLAFKLTTNPAQGQSSHLIAGTLSGCAGSKILYSRTVWQKAVPGEVVVSVVTYPPPGVAGAEVINFINAANQDMTDAGQARIVSGGVGQQQVKIEFKSRVGHGFNFVLKIYGRKVVQ